VDGGVSGQRTPSVAEWTTNVGVGATQRGGESVSKEHGALFLRPLNVHFDGFRRERLAFIDNQHAADLRSVEVRANDVLLNIAGASTGGFRASR
jgi:hypothetical protein